MNLNALRSLLIAQGFRPDAYVLGDTVNPSETYVLEPRDGGWVTFYAERGLETSIKAFPTLDEAAQELLGVLSADPTTRRS